MSSAALSEWVTGDELEKEFRSGAALGLRYWFLLSDGWSDRGDRPLTFSVVPLDGILWKEYRVLRSDLKPSPASQPATDDAEQRAAEVARDRESTDECPECHGSRLVSVGINEWLCPNCLGIGRVSRVETPPAPTPKLTEAQRHQIAMDCATKAIGEHEECPTCKGSKAVFVAAGQPMQEQCSNCRGRGRVPKLDRDPGAREERTGWWSNIEYSPGHYTSGIHERLEFMVSAIEASEISGVIEPHDPRLAAICREVAANIEHEAMRPLAYLRSRLEVTK